MCEKENSKKFTFSLRDPALRILSKTLINQGNTQVEN